MSIILIFLLFIVISVALFCIYECCRSPNDPFQTMLQYIPRDLRVETYSTTNSRDQKIFLIRIRNTNVTSNKSCSPIYLHHNLAGSSVNYVLNGRNSSIALILADKGFDVWTGNERGTYLSNGYNKQDREFWDYSFQEIGDDIASALEKIEEITNAPKIHIVGHSQGGTSIVAALSDPDEACRNRISRLSDKVLLLAPVVFLRVEKLKIISWFTCCIEPCFGMCRRLGLYRIPPSGCHDVGIATGVNWLIQNVCSCCLSKERRIRPEGHSTSHRMLKCLPSGASLKCAHHFAQIGAGDHDYTFKKFNYGEERNLEEYGNLNPPSYNFELINQQVAIFYGTKDDLVSKKQAGMLKEVIPDCKLYEYNKWHHMSFIVGLEVNKLVEDMVDFIKCQEL